MMMLTFVFWFLIFGVCYTYIFYGVILYLFSNRTTNKLNHHPAFYPRVVHVIAAYNEADIIEQKIKNSLSLRYQDFELITVVVADGSSDETPEIVRYFPNVILLFDPVRKGKVAALNRAVANFPDAELLVFSDANTMVNDDALLKMVRHFNSPEVGGVAAEKKVKVHKNGVVRGEGLYWKYESAVKKLEAGFYTVVGAAGELFAIRKSLYRPLQEDIILDDLLISLNICREGYVVRYEQDAFAIEDPSLTIPDEQIRKIRISAGAFQILSKTTDLMNPFKHGKLAFQYLSHRIMRWVFCPIAIPLIFILNGFILFEQQSDPFYLFLYIIQVVFYLLAMIGWLLSRFNIPVHNLFYIPYYASFMQVTQWKGFAASVFGNQTSLWQKAKRQYTT